MVSGTFGYFNDFGNFIAISERPGTVDLHLLESTDETMQVLTGYARATGAPVWLEHSAGDDQVVDIWFAETGTVCGITELADGLGLEIAPLASLRFLDVKSEDYARLADLVYRSFAEQSSLMLISDDENRLFDGIAAADIFAVVDNQEEPSSLDADEITPEQANALFSDIVMLDSGPLPTSERGIPFRYPDDGCWGRAHRMGKVAADAGIIYKKVWLYGSLAVRTSNNPNCGVRWRYHVAICVQITGAGLSVIDPSMFDTPVPLGWWVGAQSDPHARIQQSSGRVFYRPEIGQPLSYDDDQSRTAGVLSTYNGKLLRRSRRNGPPPYLHCST